MELKFCCFAFLLSFLLTVFDVVAGPGHLHSYSDVNTKNTAIFESSEDYPNTQHHMRYKRELNTSYQIPEMVNDSHVYYHTQYQRRGKDKYWFELSNNNAATKDEYLSSGSLRSKNFKLKFIFPYYGHPVTNLSITTGGFLYVGYVETSLKMKVMYIAPLMAFFNTSITSSSAIHYFSNASQFTVQWTNVQLQNAPSFGKFTFQCTLYKDGRIAFAYKSLPSAASNIPVPKEHHVKIGISDAFIGYKFWIVKGRFYKVRIFYIYHAIKYQLKNIYSNSSILLTPLPNCVIARNCTECINLTGQTEFACAWCSELKRCSDGLDRHRPEWLSNSCNRDSIEKYDKCAGVSKKSRSVYSNGDDETSSGTIGAIVAVLLIVLVIIAVGGWCFYAYTHPVSKSGLFLIDLRRKPGQLFRRANEARTTSTGATTGASQA